MGFLDHSTNNIIVDAVLTDKGREFLSRNDKSFIISRFAVGDDEIDYRIIEQYGRTVGKEKIEKNTPVFEAFTNSSMALKNKCVSLSNSFTTHMPLYAIGTKFTDNILAFSLSNDNQKTHSFDLTISSNSVDNALPLDLIDEVLEIELDNRFLIIDGTIELLTSDNIATYKRTASRVGSTLKLNVAVTVKSINKSTFNLFSTSNGSYIRTFIKVRGTTSGLSKTIEARIRT